MSGFHMEGRETADRIAASIKQHDEKALADKIRAAGGFRQDGEAMIGQGLRDFAQANGHRDDGPSTSSPTLGSAVVRLANNVTSVRHLMAAAQDLGDHLLGQEPEPRGGYGSQQDLSGSPGSVGQLHALNGVLEDLLSQLSSKIARIGKALGDRVG